MLQQMKIASPLSRKATLVAVIVSQWTARKLDKRITDEVNRSHGAAEDAGRYNKLLLEAKRLDKINSFVSQARKCHHRYTKPWCEDGMRILPNTLHEKFAAEFRVIERGFEEAVDEFEQIYPEAIRERKRALNGLFNPQDYPPVEEIRGKFKLKIRQFPVPDADDFRSDVLDADTIEDIRRELTETSESVLDEAMKDSARQIVEVVGHMSEKLKAFEAYSKQPDDSTKPKTFFTAALVKNVRELAELLPAFNLTNDPKFDAVVSRIQRELCVEEAEALRENAAARKTVRKSADSILKDVSALLG
jgi:hypothetical protein